MDLVERIHSLVADKGEIANRDLVHHLHVSPATSHRLLQGLAMAGVLERQGKGRSTRYRLRRIRKRVRLAGLEEDVVWRQVSEQVTRIRPLASEEERSLRYAATEVINNAIDHSGGKTLEIEVDFEGRATTTLRVVDDGVGVFRRVCEDFGYQTAQDAIVQLEKGKLTSDPTRHSGEGLFFSSKAVSRFRLESGGTAWIVDNIIADSSIGKSDVKRGTRVVMQVVSGETPRLQAVFAAFTDPQTLRFMKTRASIQLSAFGSSLISRSEAKRVTERLTEFEHAVLDFSGVEVVGQGFCDEVFRVFASRHPEVRLEPVGMNEAVEFMVRRAQARAQ
jgi:anti-sigma regulatory factor (Ser/Thr protein kinase)